MLDGGLPPSWLAGFVTMSRPPSVRTRILNALTDEAMSTLQLAERAGITARRRGEVVKLACDVLEGEGLIEREGGAPSSEVAQANPLDSCDVQGRSLSAVVGPDSARPR